jgi:hypothetical protein
LTPSASFFFSSTAPTQPFPPAVAVPSSGTDQHQPLADYLASNADVVVALFTTCRSCLPRILPTSPTPLHPSLSLVALYPGAT